MTKLVAPDLSYNVDIQQSPNSKQELIILDNYICYGKSMDIDFYYYCIYRIVFKIIDKKLISMNNMVNYVITCIFEISGIFSKKYKKVNFNTDSTTNYIKQLNKHFSNKSKRTKKYIIYYMSDYPLINSRYLYNSMDEYISSIDQKYLCVKAALDIRTDYLNAINIDKNYVNNIYINTGLYKDNLRGSLFDILKEEQIKN